MKIALIGASGYVGARVRDEALDRGHEVTAILRDPGALPDHPRLLSVALDVLDTAALTDALAGHDLVVSAFNPGKDETGRRFDSIVDAARRAGLRLIVVGGAGSLEVAPGRRLLDEPDLPEAWKAGALRTAAALDALRGVPDLAWSFVSPAAKLSPGLRTGTYRTGGDRLLTGPDGESCISLEDYAAALLDEVEVPSHVGQRFCLVY